jgi:hypothetical protein
MQFKILSMNNYNTVLHIIITVAIPLMWSLYATTTNQGTIAQKAMTPVLNTNMSINSGNITNTTLT